MFELRQSRLLLGAAALLVAAGVGYGVARWTAPAVAPAAAPSTAPQGPATLKIAPNELAAAGILVEPVRTGNLSAEILAPAVTAAQPQGVASLMAHAEGVISRLNKRLGDPVKAGEVLAVVDSKDAAQIASDRTSAEARALLARRVEAQEEALFKDGATSKRSLETAQASLAAAEADARRARDAAKTANLTPDGHSVAVISPLTGRVTSQTAALGAYVQTQTELFRVSDPSLVQVEAQLVATDAVRIHPGDPAILMLPNGAVAQASVRSVTPALDPLTRTQTAVLSVPNGLALAPGETLQVRIMPKSAASTGVVVRDDALQLMDGRDAVFVQTPGGFTVRYVTVGARGAGSAAIISGLKPNERIATRNAFLLKAELGKGAEDDE
jgi:cobalt-zinc-cadmium efflux system membrane fusion protein